ncbi:membrane protein implicated in regulation of membrane protease activity [Thermosipho japonicus]|uniref:Membrane protein implicated in regulation of membrane protease activity n=1 Tax=Thermosipho japonicus TaxID=90323 RepID=A0A841GKW8_9BACT|nr:NfeD family protein [Thermosipho japonicus]MBB6061754.1 membrane protein implicated in regulation of membrane protease activity [Thermosipho japonicus]
MAAEILTPTFFIFWFGVGALASALVAFFIGNTIWELVTFIVASGILVILTRPLANKISGEQTRKINVDEIIGKHALVLEDINNKAGTGIIKVNGDTWRAFSNDDEIVIKKGEYVKILQVEGAHVVVEKIDKGV